ncbi:MAG: 2-C-methyl-D-erythritol 4-phosphate cytidylyltransferase [Bacteroidaceae bacterium]|nr:2-C-methyl-D-erythritol 4-phosphate cytidylyltransferase [Bacteroidaceae bacterium]
MKRLYTIIVAGGKGMRMGKDLPKQFLPIDGTPILMHTLQAFYDYDPSMTLIVVLPSDQQAYWSKLCGDYHFTIPHVVVRGGETRFHSVKNGLACINEEGLVAVHDGVRPFVHCDTIDRCFAAAQESGAAVPVVEVVDSLRKVEDEESKAVSRRDYRIVQTPQVFDISLLKEAYKQPYTVDFTDDASVVEAYGRKISLVEGNRENIKITSPFDLIIAEAFLNKCTI